MRPCLPCEPRSRRDATSLLPPSPPLSLPSPRRCSLRHRPSLWPNSSPNNVPRGIPVHAHCLFNAHRRDRGTAVARLFPRHALPQHPSILYGPQCSIYAWSHRVVVGPWYGQHGVFSGHSVRPKCTETQTQSSYTDDLPPSKQATLNKVGSTFRKIFIGSLTQRAVCITSRPKSVGVVLRTRTG